MKTLIPFMTLLLLSPVSLHAEQGPSKAPRVPPVPVEKAIKLVYAHHNKTSELKPVFIDEVVYVRGEEKGYWKVGLRKTAHETGHIYYSVSADGKVASHSVVKDG